MSLSPPKSEIKTKIKIFDKKGFLTQEAIQICQDIGIDEQDLYPRDIQQFLEENQSSSSPSKIQEMRYQHYEKRRFVKINAIKQVIQLIRNIEEEKSKADQIIKQAVNINDIKQNNSNKELKLQQIINQMEKDELLNELEFSSNKKQKILNNNTSLNNQYNPTNSYKTANIQQVNQPIHQNKRYGLQTISYEYTHNKHRKYSQVRSGEKQDQVNYNRKNNNLNQSLDGNNKQILSDLQTISQTSKQVLVNRLKHKNQNQNQTYNGADDEYYSKKYTLDPQNSRSQNKFQYNTTSLSPKNKVRISTSYQNSNGQLNSSNSLSYVVDHLDYDAKLKIVRKLMRMERNDLKQKEKEQQYQNEQSEMKYEIEEKQKLFNENIAKVQKEKEDLLQKKMKDYKDHSEIVRMQVKQKQEQLQRERIKVKKQQVEEIQLRFQLDQQKLEDEEKKSFLRYLERSEEKRTIEQMKKAKQEEQIQKAKDCLEELEKEQKIKQQKHEHILSEKQKEISKKIEQRQNRAKSNIVTREQENETNRSHTIQKLIQGSQTKQNTPSNEKRRNISVFDSPKISEIRQKKNEFEREQITKLSDKLKQYDIKSKQAEQIKYQLYTENSAQKKEQFLLKKEGVLENIAIQDYQWNLQRQKEIDRYKQKIEIAKINKNIKEEIQQGVKEMYNIIKKQKES